MAFKTKEEMFGDGGGFGAAVPVDTSNPAGTGAGNRGIQFGEQLTAAIANRTHWALALNTEDLNTRLAAFEVGGLNGAYDNGSVGPAGGGRDITKDAGAVETVSSHSAMSGDTADDNAHFRADSLSDTAGSSVGFDFLSKRVGASGQSGFDAIAGVLDRRVLAKATGLTILTDAIVATLNPGGALPTTVRLSAGQIHTGGSTDLARNYDLVEISGGSADDGLYVFSNVGALTTEAILTALDGSAPSFTADEPCVVTVYRVRFGSFGSFTSRSRLASVVVAGMPDATSALDIVAGKNQSDTPAGGSDRALRIMLKGTDGATAEASWFDYLGRWESSLERSSIIDEVDKNTRLGNYAIWRTHASDPGVGIIVHSYDASITQRYDHLSLVPYDPAVVPAITPNTGVTMAFTANSPITGELLFNAPQDADLPNYLFGVGMFVEISGAGTADGLYAVAEHVVTGNQGFLLRKADGSVTSHFPVGGTCTLVAVYAASGIGRYTSFPNTEGFSTSPVTVTAHNVLSGGPEADAVSLAMFMPNNVDSGNRAFIRMFGTQSGSGDNYQEKFSVNSLGEVRARGAVYAGAGSASTQGFVIDTTNVNAEFRYATGRSRTLVITLTDLLPRLAEWTLENMTAWRSEGDFGGLFIPLNRYLASGMTITGWDVVVKPGTARATSGNRTGGQLLTIATDFTPASGYSPITTSVGATVRDDGTTDTQTISLAGLSEVVDLSATEYLLQVAAGSDGATNKDRVYHVRIAVTDPGPRNF